MGEGQGRGGLLLRQTGVPSRRGRTLLPKGPARKSLTAFRGVFLRMANLAALCTIAATTSMTGPCMGMYSTVENGP